MLPFPADLLRATRITWRMATSHALAESPFSGHTQVQRGQLERFECDLEFARIPRHLAQQAIAFFLRLENNLHPFTMADPSAVKPLGPATGTPVVATLTAARAATVPTAGWTPNSPAILKAGDWIQIGDQLCRATADVPTAADGTAEIPIWPRLMIPMPATTPVKCHPATGIFRFASPPAEWDIDAALLRRSHTFRLTARQVILLPP